MLGLVFSSKQDWGSQIVSITEIVSEKFGVLICSRNFLSPKVALCLCKSRMRPIIEYYCPVGQCYYLILESQIHSRNGYLRLLLLHWLPLFKTQLIMKKQAAQFFSIGITLVDVYLSCLIWFHSLILLEGSFVIKIDGIVLLSPLLDFMRMSMSTVFFLAQLQTLEFSAFGMPSSDL